MRLLMLLLVLFGWALPVSAAQTFVLPVSVVPGSVLFSPPAGPDVPASMPLSKVVEFTG